MTGPTFLNSTLTPFYYHQTTGMTDVATAITDIRTALVTNLLWTEPSTALFKMPVGTDGRWFDALFTRISATNLEMRVRNHLGQTLITRRIQIDGAGTAVNYFCNSLGFIIESLRATPEIHEACALDISPDTATELQNYIVGNGYRTNADGVDGNAGIVGQYFAFDNGTSGQLNRATAAWAYDSTNAVAILLKTGSGNLIFTDVMVYITQGPTSYWTGRIPHLLMSDPSVGAGVDETVGVGDAAPATFRSLGLSASTKNERFFARKA